MRRRDFLLGAAAAGVSLLDATPTDAKGRDAAYVLCGDSLAYMLGPAFHEVAKQHGVPVDVVAVGGSSARQWLKKKWFEKVHREHPIAREFIISLGVNCTRVERPKLAEDVSKIVNLVNDFEYEKDGRHYAPTPVWLLPPPLAQNCGYLYDAVQKSEVFAFSPRREVNLLEDGIHPSSRGARAWAEDIAEVLWD